MLVTGRSFDGAEDVAGVLHHRLDRYVTGVGYPTSPASEFVAGLFPRPTGISDPDVMSALIDRADAIEQRARDLAMIAIERGDAWVRQFGDAPTTSELHDQWVQAVSVGAAYRDRWSIDDHDAFLDQAIVNHEQEAQRRRVLSFTLRFNVLTVVDDASTKAAYVLLGADVLEPSDHHFGLEL
jgi:hypothetical protein